MPDIDNDILMHYGVKRRSGRYPWGSGDTPYQRSGDFLSRIDELKKDGWTETPDNIFKSFGLSTTEYRVAKQVAGHERHQLLADKARSLRDDGKSLNEIAAIMGYNNDSSIRALLNENTLKNKNIARTTADVLSKEVSTKKVLDVGSGVEIGLGISETKLKEALYILEAEGHPLIGVGLPQVTNPGKQTTVTVLGEKGKDVKELYREIYNDFGIIKSVGDYHSDDGGSSYTKLEYPASIDSKRVKICYGDEVGRDGHKGMEKDGVIEIRRGNKDLDLGNSHYAQVRILVDDGYYLKGMAMYGDSMPDGVDIIFNTNKPSGTPMMDGKKGVLKPIKHDDPNNPFGAAIKANGQSHYKDEDGNDKLSVINKLKEEGDWDLQARNLSSQFLSKQPEKLIRSQLNLTYADYLTEYDNTCQLTNPTIKKKLLMDFANECDSAAIHMKATPLPRQATQVILPMNSMPENEIYAPNYRDGEKVVLIRYPHGGTFEIPELKVNNKNATAKKILGNVSDAVGINSKVAEKLSGADFDGDTAVVIPVGSKVKVKTSPSLKELANFEPKVQYAEHAGMKYMTKDMTQKEMGKVSNLITDMTLRGAPVEDITRAVKHSMVVIDAEKHRLDYKQSEKDNGIAELKQKWQVRVLDDGTIKEGGASTLLSRRKQTEKVPERQGSAHINEDGSISYKESGRMYVDKKTGKLVPATNDVSIISTHKDVRDLSSGTIQEDLYADHANKLKALANQARKEAMATEKLKYSPSAKEVYQKEVDSLNAKINNAAMNAPRERRAQAIANSKVKAMIQENPKMDKKDIKKASNQAINNARADVAARGKDTRIKVTDKEWEAIQAGAITDSKLTQILRYADGDSIKQRAMPKATSTLSLAQVNKIKQMNESGYTNAQIAENIGKSASTISKALREE